MFGAMYRGITGFFKDVKQISDEKRPPSINTNVNNSRNNKLPSGGGGNSFNGLMHTADRLEAQDRRRSQMISEEDCRKRMKDHGNFFPFLIIGSFVALLMYFFS